MVWLLALGNENVQAGLLGWELCSQFLACHVLRTLYHPQMEYLSLNNEVVLVGNLLLDVGNLLAWETGNDTVYEGSANVAAVCEPALEALIVYTEVFFP